MFLGGGDHLRIVGKDISSVVVFICRLNKRRVDVVGVHRERVVSSSNDNVEEVLPRPAVDQSVEKSLEGHCHRLCMSERVGVYRE